MNKQKKIFRVTLWIIIACTVIACALVLVLPFSFKVKESNDEIVKEMVGRIESVMAIRDRLNLLTLTPFMCDEALFLDNSVDENELKTIAPGKTSYIELKENEQRIVFFYKNRLIADIIIPEEEIEFEIPVGEINTQNGWFYIDNEVSGIIRLHRED